LGKKLKSPQTLPEFLYDVVIEGESKEVRFHAEFVGITKGDSQTPIINSPLFSTE